MAAATVGREEKVMKYQVKEDKRIPRGKWYFPCCEQDLSCSEGEHAMWDMDYYDHKWEAQVEIVKMYLRSIEHIGLKSAFHGIRNTFKK